MNNTTDSFAALRIKDFRLYVGLRFFFSVANQMQIVVIGFYIYELTKSAFSLGMLGLCEAIPAIGIALYGGYIADKSEKRKMLFLIYSTVLLTSGVLFVVTLKSMNPYVPMHWIVPVIYAMTFCNGVARAFYAPAAFTVLAHSVPKELYANAGTWSSSSWQLASILGPAIGGLIYGFSEHLFPGISGITASFAVIMLLILISLVLISRLKPYPPMHELKENIWKSISAGLHFVFHNKIMLGAMSLDLFSVFFGGAVALLPVFADEVLKVGAEGLGLMRAMISIGAVLVMLVMSKYSPMGKPWRNLLVAVTGFGISIICFALSRNFYLSLVCLFMYGAFDSVSVLIRTTIMQLLVPSDMRGRVSSVNSMFINSSNEIGDFESGTLASLMGTIPAVIFGGCMTLLVAAVTFFKTKKIVPLSLQEINEGEERSEQ
ncbi:MAG: Enterobactin exporter EntS [Chitinophagaceae bacterium]|nr:Enterobactin exporter EntS [Chitinophagaceae bacterium]